MTSDSPEVTVHGVTSPWPGPHFAMVEKAKQEAYAEGYRHYRTPDHEGIDKDLSIGMGEIWQEAEIAQRLMDGIGIPVPEVGYGGDVDVRVAVLILRLRQTAEALNLLAGELTVEQWNDLPEEIKEVCQAVHQQVDHS